MLLYSVHYDADDIVPIVTSPQAESGSLETATSIKETGLPTLTIGPLVVQEVVPWANMDTTYNNTLFCHTPRNPHEAASESDDDVPACQEFLI